MEQEGLNGVGGGRTGEGANTTGLLKSSRKSPKVDPDAEVKESKRSCPVTVLLPC